MSSPIDVAVAAEVFAVLPPGAAEGLDPDAIAQLLAPPPNADMGDLAFPCFRFAKALRKGPPIIAKELAQALARRVADHPSVVASAEAAGPYVNVRLDIGRAAASILPKWAGDEVPIPEPRDQKVMVEYSQPNTHKAFHVGHMRNVCLGDSLVRLLRGIGHEVVAANYLGDVGAHIAKCLWFFLDELDDDGRLPPDTGKGEWLGQIYARATLALEDWEKAAEGGDAEARQKLETARARMTELLTKLEQKDPEVLEIWNQTRQWSLDEFDEIYAWAGVTFDRIFYESEVDQPGLEIVDEFVAKGVFVESEGAIGIFNEEIPYMPFFMLRKRDGTGLYATKDLALARLKFEEFGVDRSIYVVDARQSDHFKHVFLTLEKMGFAQAQLCYHVPYEMVELPEGAMSTRRGTVVLFRELRERLDAAIRERLRQTAQAEGWSSEQVDHIVHQVSLGAIKYGMLERDVNQKIVFDMDAWTKFEGDTGPYLQYVAARTASILRKGAERGAELTAQTLGQPAHVTAALAEPAERALVLEIARLPDVVANAAQKLRPSLLCTYLFELCKTYNAFNQQCPVLKSEGDLLQARLLLVAATRGALAHGLDLLGIPAPERM